MATHTLAIGKNLIVGLKILLVTFLSQFIFVGLAITIVISSIFAQTLGKVLFGLFIILSLLVTLYLQGLFGRLIWRW